MFIDRLQTFVCCLNMTDWFYFSAALELSSCNLDLYNPISCHGLGMKFFALKINPASERKKIKTVTFPTRSCTEDWDAAQ